MPKPFVTPTRVKSFSDYFELSADTEDVLSAFGYEYERRFLPLPRQSGDFRWADILRDDMMAVIPNVDLTNETA